MTVTQASDLNWFEVKLTHPTHNKKTVFRSLSEKRARDHVERRFPRGSEVYLLHPDGRMESYEKERSGDMGVEDDQWKEFDPATYNPPDMQPPPGDTIWGDKEG